jgi:ribulose kinase
LRDLRKAEQELELTTESEQTAKFKFWVNVNARDKCDEITSTAASSGNPEHRAAH